jgi:hypothetical protein
MLSIGAAGAVERSRDARGGSRACQCVARGLAQQALGRTSQGHYGKACLGLEAGADLWRVYWLRPTRAC